VRGSARAGGRGKDGPTSAAVRQWYHVDDGRVEAVDEAMVAGAQAYLLFYSRREGGNSGGGAGGGGGGVPVLDSGGSSSSTPRDADTAAAADTATAPGAAPGAAPAAAWGDREEADGSRRPLTARRLRQFRARRRREPTPGPTHTTPVSEVSTAVEAPAANASPPPRRAARGATHGGTHSLTRQGRRLGQSLPPRLRQAFSHRRVDASSSAAVAARGGGGGGAASDATLLLDDEARHAAGMDAFDTSAELDDLFGPRDAPASSSLEDPASCPSPAASSRAADEGHGGMGSGGCDLSASLPVPVRGRSARWRRAGGLSPLRRMGSARERRGGREAREAREAREGSARREGSAGREAREAWNAYTTPRLGRRRPWHRHTRIHSWAPDEATHSPTRQRCDKVDLASSAPLGGSWPGGER
jgi:hypothetical protein